MKFQDFTTPAFWLTVLVSKINADPLFKRMSTFNVCSQLEINCNTNNETSAETIWYFEPPGSGETFLVYTDSPQQNVGFVEITDMSNPVPDGTIPVGGEPTSVRVIGNLAVVAVDTSVNFVNPSGNLVVIDLNTRSIVQTFELPGQPDAVDVTKSDKPGNELSFPIYIAIAIENQLNEEIKLPQLPGGSLVIIDIPDEIAFSDPSSWVDREIEIPELKECQFPTDPEPEYVSINAENTQVVVTLQENNCNIIVELESGDIIKEFNAGSVFLDNIDTVTEPFINQTFSGTFLREADGVAWIGKTGLFATANEGDLQGGSRGFTIFSGDTGEIIYDSGNTIEIGIVSIGHYPEERSAKKGGEVENVLYDEAALSNNDTLPLLFVLSERGSVVFVYDVSEPRSPILLQSLPVGVAPEGLTFIPSMNALAVACEEDSRKKKIRSSITLFKLFEDEIVPEYPTLVSTERIIDDVVQDVFIPFSALSSLAATTEDNRFYTVEDSFYLKSRILEIDTTNFPAVVTSELRISDKTGVLANCLVDKLGVDVTIDQIINDDKTVNIDPEGIASSSEGGFWIASEGKGTIGDEEKPFEFPNLLLKTSDNAEITECILLPDDYPSQFRFGFEGVTQDGDNLVVTFQRAWKPDVEPRIAVYNTSTQTWKYAFYPLDEPESQNGGWVGLSDISLIPPKFSTCGTDSCFLVLERDNQGGPDAVIKRIYEINLGDYTFEDGKVLDKKLFQDVVPKMLEPNGEVFEKVEGLAISPETGRIWILNDNDGVDDNSGEQQLIVVDTFFTPCTENCSCGDANEQFIPTTFTIGQAACVLPLYSTLCAALEKTGLLDVVSQPGSAYTVFAPTNKAFANLDPDVLDFLFNTVDGISDLKDILLYHVGDDVVVPSDLLCSSFVPVLFGGKDDEGRFPKIRCADDIVGGKSSFITGPGNSSGRGNLPRLSRDGLVISLTYCNGVVYGIDNVIAPKFVKK